LTTTYLPLTLNINHPENQVKKLFKDKFKKIISLHINSIQISEFMTRSQAMDENHLQNLMSAIQEEGYLPESSIWVNAISGPGGEEIMQYRLIGGRHRLEACRRLGIEEIPALIFQDLTDEEECLADRISNEKDSRHKKVTYMEEARHCIYLKETKGWSTRQIARSKGISKSAVGRKIQLAKLPPKVQDIFMTVPFGTAEIPESHLQTICKLKAEPHQVMVCKKLIGDDIDQPSESTEQTKNKTIPATDVKKMVKELLIMEAQGQIAEEAMKYIRDEKVENIDYIVTVETKEDINISATVDKAWELLTKNILKKITDERERLTIYSTAPLWLKHCKAASELTLSSFYLLMELVSNDLRFKPDKKRFFFIHHGTAYENTEDYLSAILDVKSRTLKKKLLPSLDNYITYKKDGAIMKFRVKWDELFELYLKHAHKIPFKEGGLSGLPEDFNGKLQPTPYHSIQIENGHVKQVKPEDGRDISVTAQVQEQANIADIKSMDKQENIPLFIREPEQSIQKIPEVMDEDTHHTDRKNNTTEEYVITEHPIATVLKEKGMADKQIKHCVSKKNIETTLNILKYINEMKPAERNNIKSFPGYIYGMVKKGFTPPEGFETYRTVEERTLRRKTAEEVGTVVMKKFRSGDIKYFCPEPGVKSPLKDVPNTGTFIFICDNGIQAGSFGKWPDEKYFR